jgi:hypothetical protein
MDMLEVFEFLFTLGFANTLNYISIYDNLLLKLDEHLVRQDLIKDWLS